MIESVVIVGSGNVAEALACAVSASSLDLRQVFGRNEARVAAVSALAGCGGETDPAKLAAADIYLIAVSDRAVPEVAASLPIPPTAVVAHTAGGVTLDALPARFPRRAVFYPFQTFTKGRRVNFAQIPLLIETASPELRQEMFDFAGRLSRRVLYADSTVRSHVHLAGVLACNFANHCFELGGEVLRRAGLSCELLAPLIGETVAKALAAERPADVQTGPAVRGDLATQERHLQLLADDERLSAIYRLLSQDIWETSKKTL